MSRFMLSEGSAMVFLPGRGRVRKEDVLMGEQYRQFSPRYLVEVPDPPDEPALEDDEPPGEPLEATPSPGVPLEARTPPPPGRILIEAKPRRIRRRAG